MLHSPSQKQVGLGARWVNVRNRFGKKHLHFHLGIKIFGGAESKFLLWKILNNDNNNNNNNDKPISRWWYNEEIIIGKLIFWSDHKRVACAIPLMLDAPSSYSALALSASFQAYKLRPFRAHSTLRLCIYGPSNVFSLLVGRDQGQQQHWWLQPPRPPINLHCSMVGW